jgi:hypothetical protein
LANELGEFISNFGEAELNSLLAGLKASRDESKKMEHPWPTSPISCPAVIEKYMVSWE